jgi:hypothetical protein
VKVKCSQEQEFVVAGFTRSDARLPFASLVLALHDKGGLRYAGHVGTGFSDAERTRLRRLFEPLARKVTPLAGKVPADVRLARDLDRAAAPWWPSRSSPLTGWCGTRANAEPGATGRRTPFVGSDRSPSERRSKHRNHRSDGSRTFRFLLQSRCKRIVVF